MLKQAKARLLNKKNFVACLSIVLIGLFVLAPIVSQVRAESEESVFEDITWEDIGAQGLIDFSNVTYTLDGTGSDVLERIAGLGASLASLNSIKGISGFRLNVMIGIGIFLPETGAGASLNTKSQSLITYDQLREIYGIPAVGYGAETNGTTSDEAFAYDEKAKYETGDHDFSTDFDDSTDWYNDNVTTACAAITMDNDYNFLNESLTEDTYMDIDTYFNNKGHSDLQGPQSTSYVVGYSNLEEGVINDLRAWIAWNNSVEINDVVIQSYNLSQMQISYNYTENFRNQIQRVTDYYVYGAGSGSALISAALGLTLPTPASVLTNIQKSVTSAQISLGTQLQQFGSSISKTLSNVLGSAKSTATSAANTVTGLIKSGLSTGSNLVVDITKMAGDGVKNLAQVPMNVATSVVSGVTSILSNPIIVLVIIGALIVGGFFLYRYAKKKDII
ncbi:MAG: hypothetical protein A2V66_15570 [Ignavibacteria bacterium RBG_13_36_8]|nr:MAG: hypothetical protein A2V66_15570 [Ignavibacteria bacterium RBG_13_36_8]